MQGAYGTISTIKGAVILPSRRNPLDTAPGTMGQRVGSTADTYTATRLGPTTRSTLSCMRYRGAAVYGDTGDVFVTTHRVLGDRARRRRT